MGLRALPPHSARGTFPNQFGTPEQPPFTLVTSECRPLVQIKKECQEGLLSYTHVKERQPILKGLQRKTTKDKPDA